MRCASGCDPARAPSCDLCLLAAMSTWTGPLDRELTPHRDKLLAPVPPERWPYGPPEVHQPACILHGGGLYCDCAASDASDVEWGRGA